jgi:hypothetical protein
MTKLIVVFRNFAKAPNERKLRNAQQRKGTQRIAQNADFLFQPSALWAKHQLGGL